MLDDCGVGHGEGGEEEADGDARDGAEGDVEAAQERVEELVHDGDEDDDCEGVDAGACGLVLSTFLISTRSQYRCWRVFFGMWIFWGVMILLHDIVRDTVGLHSSSLSVEALEMAVEKVYRVDDTHEMKLFVIWP